VTKIIVTKLSDRASLLCLDMGLNDPIIAHTQIGCGGWTTVGPVGSHALMIDEDGWPAFVWLIKAVDEERKRLAECSTAATP
jgi:hypothetical protein